MKIDLHGYRVEEAFEEILLIIEEALTMGDKQLGIVHGYRHGQKLKNFFRSQQFHDELRRRGFYIKRSGNRNNPGYTSFEIQLK